MIACAIAGIEFVIFSLACHYLWHPRQCLIVSWVFMRKERLTMSLALPHHSRRMFATMALRAGLGGALALAAGMAKEQSDVAARRKRRGGRNRKSVDTATSTTSTNDATHVSVAIGEPGAPGPSVEVTS